MFIQTIAFAAQRSAIPAMQFLTKTRGSFTRRPRYGKKFSVPELYGNTIVSGNKTMF